MLVGWVLASGPMQACRHPPHQALGRARAGCEAGAAAAGPHCAGPRPQELRAPEVRAAVNRLPSSSGQRCQRHHCFAECPLGSPRSAGGHPVSGECASTEHHLDAPSSHLRETFLMPILQMGK